MSHPLRHAWHVFEQRLNERTARERAILCLAAVVLIYTLADATVFGTNYTRLQNANRNTVRLQQEYRQQQQQSQALQLMLQADPNTPFRQRQKQLQEQLEQGEIELGKIESTLIQPQQAVSLLRDIIKAHPGARISGLKLLSPKPIRDPHGGEAAAVATQATAAGAAPAEAAILLWRHDIEVQLEGGYLDILAYVEALERQPWRFTWPQLKIETTAPGRAKATLVLGSYSRTNTLVKL